MKECSLFYNYEIQETRMVQIVFLVSWFFRKLSMRRGAWAWFHDIWTCGGKVLEH
jgi:hypothetical protein